MTLRFENPLSFVCYPSWEEILSTILFLWSLDSAFSRIQTFVYSKTTDSHDCFGWRLFGTRNIFLSLVYCAIMFVCACSPMIFYPTANVRKLFVAASLFFFVADVDAFLWSSQCSITSLTVTDFRSHATEDGRFFFGICHSVFVQEKLITLLLKLFGFGVGATCGYRGLELVCRMVLVQQLMYVFSLFLFALLTMFMNAKEISYATATGLGQKRPIGSNNLRRRTRSCSAKVQSYPERCPVSVSTVLHHKQDLESQSPVQERIKYLMVIVLCLLYLHNQFVTWLGEDQQLDIGLPNTTTADCPYSSSHSQTPSFFVRYFWWQWPRVFNRTTLNLGLFGVAAVLLHWRVKLRTVRHTELLDLTVTPDPGTLNDRILESDEEDNWASSPNGITDSSVVSQKSALPVANHHPTEQVSARKTCDGSVLPSEPEGHDRSRHLSDASVSDEELLNRLSMGQLKTRDLEALVRNPNRAVELRRADLCRLLSNTHALERLPSRDFDYRFVHGQCCEEVIGYIPIPVGKVGPLLLDGRSHYLPLATTEGCLVASTNRGCRAIFLSGGAKSVVFRDQMTRAPVVWFPSVLEVVQCIAWIESAAGFQKLKSVFDRTSGYINLISVFPNPTGHYLHIRFAARTGDAMGMNMVSKATNAALHELQHHFPTMQVISLSGNMCTDKKAATINTILGRGKSVIAEACLPATVLAQVLHTTAPRLVRLSHTKNWTGSAMAGCPGMMGCNAHAANIVAGLFAATGQDLAQVVDAAACLTQFEVGDNNSLIATVTMPCIEVGTIGGGTRLPAQRACLDLLDLSVDRPTEHLARLIAGAVLAGELSLMAALDTDDLVSAHLRLNRSAAINAEQSDQSLPAAVRTAQSGFLTKSDASGRLEPPHPIM